MKLNLPNRTSNTFKPALAVLISLIMFTGIGAAQDITIMLDEGDSLDITNDVLEAEGAIGDSGGDQTVLGEAFGSDSGEFRIDGYKPESNFGLEVSASFDKEIDTGNLEVDEVESAGLFGDKAELETLTGVVAPTVASDTDGTDEDYTQIYSTGFLVGETEDGTQLVAKLNEIDDGDEVKIFERPLNEIIDDGSGIERAISIIEDDTGEDLSLDAKINVVNYNEDSQSITGITVDGQSVPIDDLSLGVENTDTDTYYTSIQSAIDDANSGDTIEVGSGEYSESVDIGVSDITVTSAGSENAVIESQEGPVVQINAPNVRFEGFNITGADGTNEDGQGVDVNGNGYETNNVVLRDLLIHENDDRGLVVDYSNNTTIRNVRVLNNYDLENDGDDPEDGWETSGDADGITVWYSNNTVIQNVEVVNNSDNGVYLKGNNHTVENLKAVNNGDEGLDISSDGSFDDKEVEGGADVTGLGSINNSAQAMEVEGNEEKVSITNSVMKGSPIGLQVASNNNAEVEVSQSVLEKNSEYEFRVDGDVVVDAEHNYFGSASGPEPSQIEGDVDFQPWLMENPLESEDVAEYDRTVALEDGWTILSSPGNVEDVEFRDSSGQVYDPITYTYTTSGENWNELDVTEMNPLQPVFVDPDVKAIGMDVSESDSPSVELNEGWNLVGATQNEGAQNVGDVFSDVTAVSSLVAPEARNSKVYKSESFGDAAGAKKAIESVSDQETSVYDGYWLNSDSVDTLSLPPVISEVEG